MSLIKQRDALIKNWLKEAASNIHEALKTDLTVETKTNKNDLVTNMDRSIEKQFVEKIRKHFPQDKIVSEEGYGDDIKSLSLQRDNVWFLDPIDGTINFVLQGEKFVVMLAYYEKGIGQQAYVYDLINERLYWAIKDQGVYCNDQLLPQIKDTALKDGLFASNSMFLSDKQANLNTEITKRAMGVRALGSAGLEAAEITKGNTVAYVSYGLKPWDLAPGLMLIEENGGVATQFDGAPIDLLNGGPAIMGTPAANKEIRELL